VRSSPPFWESNHGDGCLVVFPILNVLFFCESVEPFPINRVNEEISTPRVLIQASSFFIGEPKPFFPRAPRIKNTFDFFLVGKRLGSFSTNFQVFLPFLLRSRSVKGSSWRVFFFSKRPPPVRLFSPWSKPSFLYGGKSNRSAYYVAPPPPGDPHRKSSRRSLATQVAPLTCRWRVPFPFRTEICDSEVATSIGRCLLSKILSASCRSAQSFFFLFSTPQRPRTCRTPIGESFPPGCLYPGLFCRLSFFLP